MGKEMAKSGDASSILARVSDRYREQASLLTFEDGKYLEAEDCADAWRQVNSFLLSASQLQPYRLGNRHIVPRVRILIKKWGNLIPMEHFGYKRHIRMARLERNYLNVESLEACRSYLNGRSPGKHNTHGIVFGTGRKKTPPCIVSGTFYWNPGRLFTSFNLRASEVTKTLGADLHFFHRVIYGDEELGVDGAVPPWMAENLSSVIINLDMAYNLAQWFPLFDLICPGYPLNHYEHKFHAMCMRSIRLAHDDSYISKWKPERRLLAHVRRELPKYKTDNEGRVIRGPSFFPGPKKHV